MTQLVTSHSQSGTVREMDADTPVHFSPSCSVWNPSLGMVLPTFKVGLAKPLCRHHDRHTQRCMSQVILEPV